MFRLGGVQGLGVRKPILMYGTSRKIGIHTTGKVGYSHNESGREAVFLRNLYSLVRSLQHGGIVSPDSASGDGGVYSIISTHVIKRRPFI